MKNFKQLVVWQKGIELVKLVYLMSKKFPDSEKFGLISQMTRASVFIPANIAEGRGRASDTDYARCITISLGSAFELETYLILGKELGWLTEEDASGTESLLEEIIRMLLVFYNKLCSPG